MKRYLVLAVLLCSSFAFADPLSLDGTSVNITSVRCCSTVLSLTSSDASTINQTFDVWTITGTASDITLTFNADTQFIFVEDVQFIFGGSLYYFPTAPGSDITFGDSGRGDVRFFGSSQFTAGQSIVVTFDTMTASEVANLPEPSSLVLFGVGIIAAWRKASSLESR